MDATKPSCLRSCPHSTTAKHSRNNGEIFDGAPEILSCVRIEPRGCYGDPADNSYCVRRVSETVDGGVESDLNVDVVGTRFEEQRVGSGYPQWYVSLNGTSPYVIAVSDARFLIRLYETAVTYGDVPLRGTYHWGYPDPNR